MKTIDDRVALAIFDGLIAKEIRDTDAAFIAQQVSEELRRDNKVDELFAVRVVDTDGQPHACVMRQIPAGTTPLFRFDIRGLRGPAHRELLSELKVDAVVDDDSTEI